MSQDLVNRENYYGRKRDRCTISSRSCTIRARKSLHNKPWSLHKRCTIRNVLFGTTWFFNDISLRPASLMLLLLLV
jgi:hypothetical protein